MVRLEGLIFDVDGTIADTEKNGHLMAFNLAFLELNLNWVWSIDLYAKQSGEQIFIQLGYTRYKPQNSKYKNFLNKKKLLKIMNAADLIITQGGFGSIADCLRAEKKVIAVPRKPELNESTDRQIELVRELERQGRLVGLYNIANLSESIQMVKKIKFKRDTKNHISLIISQFIFTNE